MIQRQIHRPLIIIGMHRSGTTLVADALNSAGVFMGVFREHNGEALHFLSLNQQMLAAAGADWLNPVVPAKEADKTLPACQIFAEHIKSPSSNPLRLRLMHNLKWGWKDPRNTFTLPRWLERFPQAKVLHVIRDGRAVAMSLKVRNQVKGEVYDARLNDLAFNLSLWEKYVEKGISYKNELGKNYHEVKYEDIVAGDSGTLSELEKFTHAHLSKHLHVKNFAKRTFPPELEELAGKSELLKKLGYGH